MATDQRRHFAHPQHLLLKTPYSSTSTHFCDICQAGLRGLVGYRCNACDFDIHEACADYFKESISFFAHPWHTLTLCRMPLNNKGWICDLCREDCPSGNFVYRCVQCAFDVHPLCTLLPQTIRSPLHPQHDLNMVPATGRCAACLEDVHIWHYRCGYCLCKLHIGCTTVGAADRRNSSQQGTSNTDGGQGMNTSQTTSSDAQNTAVVRRSRSNSVAKFLLKKSFFLAINVATAGLASPVLDVLEAALDA